ALPIGAGSPTGAPFLASWGVVCSRATAEAEGMTNFMQVAEPELAAIDQAQLHLALASVSYMSGQTARSRAEAEAVLVEPGLPTPMYAAAENRRVLALLANGNEL